MRLTLAVLMMFASFAHADGDVFSPINPSDYIRIVKFQSGGSRNTRYAFFDKSSRIFFADSLGQRIGRVDGYAAADVWRVARSRAEVYHRFLHQARRRFANAAGFAALGGISGMALNAVLFWLNLVGNFVQDPPTITAVGLGTLMACTATGFVAGAVRGAQHIRCSADVFESLKNFPRLELETRRSGMRDSIDDFIAKLDADASIAKTACEVIIAPAGAALATSEASHELAP